jgi:hypothetical protein
MKWNDGMAEYWNTGTTEKIKLSEKKEFFPFFSMFNPSFHYSITPLLHYSVI